MNESYLLGLDFGTQSAKALLMDKNGKVCDIAQKEYVSLSAQSGFAEQHPEQWESALADVCNSLKQQEPDKFAAICAVGISAQMHGLVLLDTYDKPLGSSLLWNDIRGNPTYVESQLHKLKIAPPNPVVSAYSAVKLDYLSKERPEEFAQACKILFVKDYINYLLTGEICTDPTDASGSLMYDFKTHTWYEGIEAGMNLPANLLPSIKPSIGRRGIVSRKAAECFAIAQNTPVCAVGGDLVCGAMGAGMYGTGDTLVILGTAGQVIDISPCFCDELIGKKYFFENYDGTNFLGLCSLPSAGQSLSWLAKTYGNTHSLNDMDKLAEAVPIGADGLLFAPYLQGSGSPYMNETMRGAFVGLSNSHTFAHLARAVMEGVCMGVKDCVRLNGSIPSVIKFAGGGSKSQLWAQMMANIHNAEIQCLSVADASPVGAALLCGVGCGMFASLKEAAALVAKGKTFTPDPTKADLYHMLYERYRRIYPSLFNLTVGECEKGC